MYLFMIHLNPRKIVKFFLRLAQIFLFFILFFLSFMLTPFKDVSDFVSSNFPWPHDKSFLWPILLFEGLIAPFINALLYSYPIAFLFRKISVPIAIVLALPFIFWWGSEIKYNTIFSYSYIFIIYQIFFYVLFLVTGTALARKHLLSSNISIETTAQKVRDWIFANRKF